MLAFVIAQEYGTNINYDWTNFEKALTRRYYQFCSEGPFTVSCLNGFWTYIESISGSHDLKNAAYYVEKYKSYSSEDHASFKNLSMAILHPGETYGNEWVDPVWAKEKCTFDRFCGWVTINSSQEGIWNFLLYEAPCGYKTEFCTIAVGGTVQAYWDIEHGTVFLVLTWNAQEYLCEQYGDTASCNLTGADQH
ncbi:MAG: hypothetical protein OEZ02_11290 [Anaerolineae bacterium]|nr:hypothetical protein [Anaerolineae bacterium]